MEPFLLFWLMPELTALSEFSFSNCLKNYGELYKDHIKYAQTIVLSKCDLRIEPTTLQDAILQIKSLNPNAEIVQTCYENQSAEFWQNLFRKKLDGSVELPQNTEPEPATEFESLSVDGAEIPSVGRLVAFLENLIRSRYGKIVRVKGTVKCAGELLRVDFAGDKYFIESAEQSSKNCLVIIGQNLNSYSIKKRITNKIFDIPKNRTYASFCL